MENFIIKFKSSNLSYSLSRTVRCSTIVQPQIANSSLNGMGIKKTNSSSVSFVIRLTVSCAELTGTKALTVKNTESLMDTHQKIEHSIKISKELNLSNALSVNSGLRKAQDATI